MNGEGCTEGGRTGTQQELGYLEGRRRLAAGVLVLGEPVGARLRQLLP